MAGFPSFTPAQDAAYAVDNVSRSMADTHLALARLKYMQAREAQRQAIALGQLAVRQKLAEAQLGNYQSQGQVHQAQIGRYGAAEALDKGKLQAAEELGNALSALHPADWSQGPTMAGARTLSLQDAYRAIGKSSALSGDANTLLMPHNVGANQISSIPLTGEVQATGPMVLSPGSMYQLPGLPAVTNPRPYNVPPGNTMVQDGKPIYTAPYKPDAPQKIWSIMPELFKLNDLGQIPEEGRGFYTNALATATQAMQGMQKSGGQDKAALRSQAIEALKTKDPTAVRARYKELTGEDADF